VEENIKAAFPIQRAVFLRGVDDPSEKSRITTTFYRPKHMDLRYEEGFVKAGYTMVPLNNVVEMIALKLEVAIEAPEAAPIVEALETSEKESVTDEEDKPARRRGRPRKIPVG
jgi:hypothetical protein